jgi:hypothetical protein
VPATTPRRAATVLWTSLRGADEVLLALLNESVEVANIHEDPAVHAYNGKPPAADKVLNALFASSEILGGSLHVQKTGPIGLRASTGPVGQFRQDFAGNEFGESL